MPPLDTGPGPGPAPRSTANITRTHNWGLAPPAARFVIVPSTTQGNDGEFRGYAGRIAAHLSRLGFVEATPRAADVTVSLGYGLDPAGDIPPRGNAPPVFGFGVQLNIARIDGAPLFDAKATTRSDEPQADYLVPSVIEAIFADFPGASGSTRTVTLPRVVPAPPPVITPNPPPDYPPYPRYPRYPRY